MQPVKAELYPLFSRFLTDIRRFFAERDCLEVETPLLNPCMAVEAHLDSFTVIRETAAKSPLVSGIKGGYLITSPEYNLKILLSKLQRDLFQIAHCFRSGERGSLHREEFLILEWYRIEKDEHDLMEECEQLVRYLSAQNYACRNFNNWIGAERRSVNQLFRRYVGCLPQREYLQEALIKNGLQGNCPVTEWTFEELFNSLFLNLIESSLGCGKLEFIYFYPPELAALSRVENGYARRFELYWQGRELANGYYELRTKEEYMHRFDYENRLRKEIGKQTIQPDRRLIAALEERALPECSGVAIGLDRLLMVLLGKKSLDELYGDQ